MSDLVWFDQAVLNALSAIADSGVKSAAAGFSEMVGRAVKSGKPMASLVPILKIPNYIGGPDDDAVGIYLRFDGDLEGQVMLIVPYSKAYELVDLLVGEKPGTTQELGSLEKSAMGELGNLCASFFLNSLAKSIGASFRPTPPAVMVDMVGAILDIVVATTGGVDEHILLLHSAFADESRFIDVDFWVIPDTKILQELLKKTTSL